MFPEANVPVVQLSIDADATPEHYFALGRALQPLRENGILIIGSGNIVHNLARVEWPRLNERNYAADDQGRWYFQNGPQRVYVELEATPWVWRVQEDYSVAAHTGQITVVKHCLLDEHGWLYLETALGIGLVHTQDVAIAAQALEAGLWTAHPVQRLDLPVRYGFVISPAENQKLLQK